MWVVGASGLIGSSLVKALRYRADHNLFSPKTPIAWPHPDWKALINEFKHRVSRDPWHIIWAAGAMRALDNADVGIGECRNFGAFCTSLGQSMDLDTGSMTFVSSAGGIYGASSGVPISVETRVAPANAYGWSKLCQEEKVIRLQEEGLSVSIVRPTNVYGVPMPRRVHRGIVGRLLAAAMSESPVRIYSPLASKRDYIYADDLADVIVDLISSDRGSPDASIFLLGSGKAHTLGGVIDLVEQVAKRKIDLIMDSIDHSQPYEILVDPNYPGEWRTLRDGVETMARTVFDRWAV